MALRAYVISGGTEAERQQIKSQLYKAGKAVTADQDGATGRRWFGKKKSPQSNGELQSTIPDPLSGANQEAVIFCADASIINGITRFSQALDLIMIGTKATKITRDQIKTGMPNRAMILLENRTPR